MTLDQRILSISLWGTMIQSFLDDVIPEAGKPLSGHTWNRMKLSLHAAIEKTLQENGWFTREQIFLALNYWAGHLTLPLLEQWMLPYREALEKKKRLHQVGVVMAGNIPMVGFHDLLSVLIAGDTATIKLSSQDQHLIPTLAEWLTATDSRWNGRVTIASDQIGQVDAIIATGSSNSSRYFHYYFGKYPHIIRKSRHGIAILNGKETTDELDGVAWDIFSFFGRGCRNISKLYVPLQMDFTPLHQALQKHHPIWHHEKYRNNYEYYKSIHLINRTPFMDGGFYMLLENPAPGGPVSVIHFSYYADIKDVMSDLELYADQIQCVVSREPMTDNCVRPGRSQSPSLSDYADGIDTIQFLSEKISR